MVGRVPRRVVRVLLLGVILAWVAGLVWFVAGLDDSDPVPDSGADAIVVLTGGSLRVEAGLDLLARGKGRKLFVSGVRHGVTVDTMVAQVPGAAPFRDCCITLGHDADNTEGNAAETARWLAAENLHSLILVTANYHMPRALFEFRRVLPADTAVMRHPVDPEGAHRGSLWSWRGTAPVVLTEYLKYLGAIVRALLIAEPQP